MTPPSVPDVFISYTAVDRDWAEWLGETVEQARKRVSLQHWDSPPGGNFVNWIDRQISRSRHVMPLYSPEYFDSEWCTMEWTAALAYAGARDLLLPALVRGCKLPAILSPITYIDLTNTNEETARLLVRYALGAERRPRIASSGFPGRKQRGRVPTARNRTSARWQDAAAFIATGLAIEGDDLDLDYF